MEQRLERAVVALAVGVCLLFASTLSDVAVSALWAPQLSAPVLPADVERPAALTVSVVEASGAPAPDTLVRVFSVVSGRAYLAASATTDATGVVKLPELPAGETWIVAERDGHARTSSRIALGAEARDVTLTLEDAERFEVVVVDPLQRPIRGVSVSLYSADPLPHQTTTDGRGLARFDSLGPPPYAVEVTAPGFDAKLLPRVGLEDSPLFVKLERLGGLDVEVVDLDGAPVADATVLVAGSSLWPARSATTDAAGRVTINGLGRGFYDLRAEKGDLISDAETGVMLERGEHKLIRLTLIGGQWLTVKVTDGPAEDAAPIANADVALVEGGVSSFPRYGRTDASGVVRLGPVAGLDATVSAQAEGYVARSAVAVEEGQTEVRIALLRGGKIVGRVVDERDFPIDGASLEVIGVDLDGMPIVESSALMGFREDHFAFALPGATPLIPAGELGVMPIVPDIPRELGPLTVTRSDHSESPWVSARNGDFELTPVTPGSVRVVARHPDYIEAISEAVDLAPGGEVELKVVMLRGGMLEGRVIEEDRTPVAGARIEIASELTTLTRVSYTAEDGTFAFASLPSSVILKVARPERPEHVVEKLTLDIPVDERREIEIVLEPPREPVLVRISDSAGYPVEQAQITATSLEPDTPLRKTLFSDDAGEAELLDARGLSLRFVVTRREHAPTVVEIERAPKTVDLTLWPGLAASGVVETRWGPVAGAALTLITPTGDRHAQSDEDGAFRFTDLAPTAANLLVVSKGHVPREIGVAIAGDGRRDVDLGRITLSEGGAVEGEVVDEEGEPVAGARVALGRVPTYLPLGPLPLGVTSTGHDGRFRLEDLPEGDAVIQAYKVGYGRSEVDVDIRARDTQSRLRIELYEDPEVDLTDAGSAASLAVTLGESREGGGVAVIFEHVPHGGEAHRAGILAGDRLLSCNGRPIRSLEHARRSLNGPISEDMVLGLGRDPDLRWRVRVNRERLRR